MVEHFLSTVSRNDSKRAGCRISSPFAAAYSWKDSGHLGWAQKSSQQTCSEFCGDKKETIGAGISSSLCSGVESGGIYLGLHEAS